MTAQPPEARIKEAARIAVYHLSGPPGTTETDGPFCMGCDCDIAQEPHGKDCVVIAALTHCAAEYKAERDAFKAAAEMQAQNATHNRFSMLRQIIEACPKAGVASGLELGVKVICDEYDALKAEKADVEASSEMFANRLRETATALGKPISGTNSSWHDIPEQVSALKAKNEKNFEALRGLLERQARRGKR